MCFRGLRVSSERFMGTGSCIVLLVVGSVEAR